MMSSEEANRIEQRIERPIPVETTTVDQYCYQNRIKLDGMKIDVEGAEALVIEGAEKTIEMYHPWVLLEFHAGLLTKEEQSRNWHKILKRSRRAVFIDGNDSRYHYRQSIKDMPQCQTFHVLLEY